MGSKLITNNIKKIYSKRSSRNPLWKILNKSCDLYYNAKFKYLKNDELKIILQDYNAIYFRVQKVANTTLKNKFRTLSKIKNTKHITKKQLKSHFSFVFVRNPYDRIVSLYIDKIKNVRQDVNGVYVEFVWYDKFYKDMPFKDFVEAICSIPDEISNRHFKSQHYFVSNSKKNLFVNYVGKMENLDKDFKEVCKKIGITKNTTLPHKNKTKRKKDYKHYYDDYTRKLIAKRYATDLKLFNYKF